VHLFLVPRRTGSTGHSWTPVGKPSRAVDAYAAGLFEGEGHVQIYATARQVILACAISMMDLDSLEWMQQHYGGALIRHQKASSPNARPQHKWTVTARDARSFLERVRPYMTSVRVAEKADLAIEFQKQKRWGRPGSNYRRLQYEYKDRMHELNRRGADGRGGLPFRPAASYLEATS
jgi:hypothetical protein